MKVSIYRYNPEQDSAPYMQDFTLELKPGEDMMVLDVLERLKQKDSTLAYRRSCREGVCGSDGMSINGMNTLACITRVSAVLNGGELPSGHHFKPAQGDVSLVLRPLPGLPVIRDLVVDMASFWKQHEQVKPWLINDQAAPAMERLQSPEERAELDGYYECILCGCCTSACPSWWWNPDKFIGPSGLLNAYRFLIDSRDTATDERLAALDDPFSLFRCRGIMNCVVFCPKQLKPRVAIGKIQRMLIDRGT
ncbi:succinate dehydrogenase iron-sulfur subunit [Neptunomonas qingdaonensis]|uniref:Fumarate reductase iron-sulfur subunit n=1 Tax=Neptunomonas qingdaonensis TaxID=1045558 RepID=A0A1I2W5H4_9GAMM|nr:succinate dehydrogenase iron-sulfur subunit [Neptunomonas qingdaonensis]SFG96572.1 succinate dehydrogenase / fumarate reductase iron-sulfur subunit [Neptunomonas qingdaonensis]